MDLPGEVRRIVEAWLREHPIEHATLKGTRGGAWFAAYGNLRMAVCRAIIQEHGWREWIRVLGRARLEVEKRCDDLRHS